MLWFLLACANPDPDPEDTDVSCGPVDGDGDGVASTCVDVPDCDDADPRVYPGAKEIVGDDTDQDCDGSDAAGRRFTASDAYAAISGAPIGNPATILPIPVDDTLGMFVAGGPISWFVTDVHVTGAVEASPYAFGPVSVGDFNGDGSADVAYRGEARAVGFCDDVASLLTMTCKSSAFIGDDVAGFTSGDVNGDGADDLYSLGQTEASTTRLRLMWGSHGAFPTSSAASRLDVVDPDSIVILGFPSPMQPANADLDGDGLSDLLSLWMANPAGYTFVRLTYGDTFSGVVDATTAGPAFVPDPSVISSYGRSFSAFDPNGDGYGDLAIATPYRSDAAAGFVDVFAGTASRWDGDVAQSSAYARIHGEIASAYFGMDMGNGTDLDGDGRDELLVGSIAGAWLFAGDQIGRVDADAALARYLPQAGNVGGTIARAADLDGDGRAEILIDDYPAGPQDGWFPPGEPYRVLLYHSAL